MVGQDVATHAYWPPDVSPSTQKSADPWILVNSTPASCTQLGLFHAFTDRPKIDLLVSGPNFGRNSTAVFALSSGTLGAALEGACCSVNSIALSFAFFDKINDPAVVAQSCRQSVRVVEWLAANGQWDTGRVFSVNVPVKDGVERQKIVWTNMLQNTWKGGSTFEEVEHAPVEDAETEEAKLRRQESQEGQAKASDVDGQGKTQGTLTKRHFKWAPKFKDVYESVLAAGPGSDGWAVKEGQTSVTALKANFMHVEGFAGELKL